jgi:hypothetical protein
MLTLESTAAGISSDDIRLRLPCDGYMWQQDLAVETGYFKTQQNDSSNEEDVVPFNLDSLENNDRSSGIGGLALTIEASESLYLITQFHNRHRLDFIGPTKVSRWLSKFRQLDSRLLQ